MLGLWIGRPSFLAGSLVFGLGNLLAGSARADLPPGKPFAVPRDRAEWDARRPSVLAECGGGPGQATRDPSISVKFLPPDSPTPEPGVIVEPVLIEGGNLQGPEPIGSFVRPVPAAAAQRWPLVVLLVDSRPIAVPFINGRSPATPPPSRWPGWGDDRSPGLALARCGFATLIIGGQSRIPLTPSHEDFDEAFRINERWLRASLDVALARPDVDSSRVAVVGLGWTGMAALRAMATDPRITCGVVAIRGVDAVKPTTHAEELTALCAPRLLNLMIGESLPLVPPGKSVGKTIERAVKGTYKVYGEAGKTITFSMFGMFPGHDSVNTRLQWMAAVEHLDKHFRPQGPTPLSHAPEPEPTLDSADKDVLNLTEHGIAGWSSEMSGRDSTWTWQDGVVRCQPKAFEYGWLRCPVAVDDFILQVDWKVPAHGNAGIFLRAQPVAWFFPPTEENRLKVMTLGLTWPSRTGLELQTQDDPGIADRYSSGSLYRHAAPASNPTHSPDQWNRSTVRAVGPRVEVWNNGIQVLDTDLNRANDTLPVPPLQGYFGLQNHGAPAEYRAVRLKRLTPGT